MREPEASGEHGIDRTQGSVRSYSSVSCGMRTHGAMVSDGE